MDIQGSRAIVTGGGTGIGAAIAGGLADQGGRVVIVGRRPSALEEVVKAHEGPGEIIPLAGDVTDLEQTLELARQAREKLGGLDILVNAAGANIRERSVHTVSPQDWKKLLEVNATGAFHWIHATLPTLEEQGRGLIVNISSIAGKRATPLGGVAYNASKFAMTALGTTTGIEAGPRGVRVTNIYPGETNTPILDERPEPPGEEYRARLLQPADVADMVVAIARLPDRARIPEMVITPTDYPYC